MRLAPLALIAFLLIPSALAGTHDAPEITDEAADAGTANLYADITRAWFEAADAGGLAIHVEFSAVTAVRCPVV